MRKLISILFPIFLAQTTYAQAEEAIAKGNDYYRSSQFDLAEAQYKAAIAADAANITARHNLANALYKQKKYEEATKVLQGIQKDVSDKGQQSTAYFNEGVIYSRQKDLEASIEAYKAALRRTPSDQQARENLQKALRELKQQQQQQSQAQAQKKPSKMDNKQADQKLKDLQAKEKDLQEKLNKQGQPGNSMPKDW
jgi:Ca-activated chloride channel family protein